MVTCKWWNNFWLNEGFGALFEYLLIELAYPDIRARDIFNLQKLQNGFKIDTEAAHPMTNEDAYNYIYAIYYDKSELDSDIWEKLIH